MISTFHLFEARNTIIESCVTIVANFCTGQPVVRRLHRQDHCSEYLPSVSQTHFQ